MDKKIRILIVEDDQATREMYVEVFRSHGYDVLEAEDGVEGLDRATKEVPDVIFTGISMPRMDGFGLMEALKKLVTTANIPIIISSHLGKEEDRKRANELGARDFIVRGFTSPNEIVERISALFLNGNKFKIIFDTTALDAPRIARDLNFNSSFGCMECDEKMILELMLKNPKEKVFEASFICPKCGWRVKG